MNRIEKSLIGVSLATSIIFIFMRGFDLDESYYASSATYISMILLAVFHLIKTKFEFTSFAFIGIILLHLGDLSSIHHWPLRTIFWIGGMIGYIITGIILAKNFNNQKTINKTIISILVFTCFCIPLCNYLPIHKYIEFEYLHITIFSITFYLLIQTPKIIKSSSYKLTELIFLDSFLLTSLWIVNSIK